MDSWIADQVCSCSTEQWGHGTWDDKTLPLSERLAGPVPSCLHCNKWHKSRIYTCAGCKHQYVNWFAHPANGYYPDKGFYCYFCLETKFPTGVSWTFALTRTFQEDLTRLKLPPRDEIVSPNHKVAKKPTYDPETQARLDKFREFLKGI